MFDFSTKKAKLKAQAWKSVVSIDEWNTLVKNGAASGRFSTTSQVLLGVLLSDSANLCKENYALYLLVLLIVIVEALDARKIMYIDWPLIANRAVRKRFGAVSQRYYRGLGAIH